MSYHTLVGDSCYTDHKNQKLLNCINEKSHVKVSQIRGQWLYYVHSTSEGALDKIKHELLQATDRSKSPPLRKGEKCVGIYITPRTISPWSSKATSIAHVCGLKNYVHRIERGRSIVIEFEDSFNKEQVLSFVDVVYDRMTENFSLDSPDLDILFAKGARKPLEVIEIFADKRGALAALQVYNRQIGLGLSQPDMEYLVAEYEKLGRSPVC